MKYSFCTCCRRSESFQADTVDMVNVACHAFQLQLTAMVMHKEVFCNAGIINFREGICYVQGF
jgi:hypothetical protein